MNIEEIRNFIVYELFKHTGSLVIPQDNPKNKPPYPYLAYKITSPYIPFEHQGNYSKELVPSQDEGFEYDIEETVELQPQMVMSINSYSDNLIESQELIKKTYDWFKHAGYYDLLDSNLVVVNIQAFGDRTLLIVDNYEYRQGFDVILRTTDTIKRRIETIEEYRIKEVK